MAKVSPFSSKILDISAQICQDHGLDNFEIFSLQNNAGSVEWLNGRNRIDLQLAEIGQEKNGQFHFRIKYFPDISILKMSTKRFLLWQIYDDFITERNGYQTIPSRFFHDFENLVTANYKDKGFNICRRTFRKIVNFGSKIREISEIRVI